MSDDPMLAKAAVLEEELLREKEWPTPRDVGILMGQAALLIQQMRVRIETTLMVIVAVLSGCGILSPATELSVENQTGAALEVLAAPCGVALTVFASLGPAGRHTEQVQPGCWRIEGWTDDGRYGEVQKQIADGELAMVPFVVVE